MSKNLVYASVFISIAFASNFSFGKEKTESRKPAGAIEQKCIDEVIARYKDSKEVEINVPESTPKLTRANKTWTFSDADGNYTEFHCRLNSAGNDCLCTLK